MSKTEEIVKRLKQFLGYENDLQLAKSLGIKPTTLSSWKNRKSLGYDKVISLCKKNRVDLNELFLVEPNSRLNVELSSRKVKMISVERQIEYFLNYKKCYFTAPVCAFPTDEEVDIAFQIGGDNMCPTVKINSYVLSKKIELHDIESWKMYVLVVERKGILCCRFKRHTEQGELVFISDNKAFDNLTVNPSDIREIFSVRGVFVPNTKNLL
ncbi:LexA family transcriptional regulator [Myroides odoratimimus]|uniref:HTH cro/C1-type domain-containing protein n=1 Tax=Myroides odoratimimus CIP 101113 TaxID=883154 RepID=A0AAV3F221_9FLAO|nr:helix-turn-helix domain-containing protein [Myroides odoratimimus]EHO09849.1 hypothetical protein HMPREF9715_02273 [Myroides odoratimimus CIP 101113]